MTDKEKELAEQILDKIESIENNLSDFRQEVKGFRNEVNGFNDAFNKGFNGVHEKLDNIIEMNNK
ncbi:hypothetical protein [Peribacillus sp. Bi134]|uniref:hypothetical protein n=1 Tax=Peribacillus sp. Bi134 TaxID=2884272 RepID=UPI001D3D650D|nr:hypothetical protein [Peribacillus sp. Bi134]CAH0283181.1 hypothetical protein SRABI134_04091 [Peribacillus sp. Bi134]